MNGLIAAYGRAESTRVAIRAMCEYNTAPNCLSNSLAVSFGHCVTLVRMIDWNELRVSQEIGGWTVDMFWIEDEIQGGPTRLVVRPTENESPPVGGVSSTVLRAIDFRAGAAQARQQLADEDLELAKTFHPMGATGPDLKSILEAKGLSDVYLVLLALEYVRRVVDGEPKPVDRIAQELGKSTGTVKGHLWQARKRELLKGGSAGRKGGYVPPEATQIAIDWWNKRNADASAD